jgi:hypothetical protein
MKQGNTALICGITFSILSALIFHTTQPRLMYETNKLPICHTSSNSDDGITTAYVKSTRPKQFGFDSDNSETILPVNISCILAGLVGYAIGIHL